MIVELSAMEQRYQAVLEVLVGGVQVTEVAERFGVSRQSVHDWVRRYKDGGIAALADQSRRPHRHPDQLEAEVEVLICELRRTQYDQIMKGFGGGGETIDTLEQVRPAVERAFTSGVPYCLNVNVRGVRSPFTQWQLSGKPKR